MEKTKILDVIGSVAVFADCLYILWILYNAVDDKFSSVGSIESIVLSSLIFLLLFNILSIHLRRKD